MELPEDAPKTPKLYFLAGDILLIAVAVLIAFRSGTPLPPAAIYAITGCVLAGALLLVLPYLLDYNRRQEMLLTERQNALEALARTTSSAVEQASIAVSGLNEVADLAEKNLKLADQLPHKVQERINEFKSLHDEAMAAELESLQQEVNTLRASEAEKLDSAADRISRAAAELAKLEPGLRKQASLLDDAAKQAEQRIAAVATRAVQDVEKGIARALEQATAKFDALRDQAAQPVATPAAAPAPKPARPASNEPAAQPASPAQTAAPAPSAPPPAAVAPKAAPVAVSAEQPNPSSSASSATAAAVADTPAAAKPASAPPPDASAQRKPTSRRSVVETAPPLFSGLKNDHPPLQGAPERAPDTIPPFSMTHREEPDETTQRSPEEAEPQPALSSDGLTRLIVTAYIGIGNKLYVRGDAPGLSWDKGTPLQFVSIGKWRWETPDASKPVSLKLYKNDQVECTALGTIRLAPGHQRELTASF